MLMLYTYQLLQKRYNLRQLIFVVFLGSPLHEFKSSNLTNLIESSLLLKLRKDAPTKYHPHKQAEKLTIPQILASRKLNDSTQLQRAQTHDKRSLLMCQSTYGILFSFLQCLSFCIYLCNHFNVFPFNHVSMFRGSYFFFFF